MLFSHFLFFCHVIGIVLCMYTDFHSYNYEYGPVIDIFIDRLAEAMCCCLQTYTVNDVLLVKYCICFLAVIVTNADIRKFCRQFTNMLPEALCCCLQTCYIYGVLLTLPCT